MRPPVLDDGICNRRGNLVIPLLVEVTAPIAVDRLGAVSKHHAEVVKIDTGILGSLPGGCEVVVTLFDRGAIVGSDATHRLFFGRQRFRSGDVTIRLKKVNVICAMSFTQPTHLPRRLRPEVGLRGEAIAIVGKLFDRPRVRIPMFNSTLLGNNLAHHVGMAGDKRLGQYPPVVVNGFHWHTSKEIKSPR